MNIKNNLPLIFGIAIPILMIAFVAISIYVPQMFIKPEYDFLYLMGENYCYLNVKAVSGTTVSVYSVKNSQLIQNVSDDDLQKCITARVPELKIFMYNVTTEKSTEVTYDYARSLRLDSSPESPDGFKIVRGEGNGGFFPFYFYSGSDYNTRYITGRNVSKKLNISEGERYYYNNFTFLGWIKK